jgi:hypothetical protein
MESAITIIGILLSGVIVWALGHAQRCAGRDAAVEHRLTRIEERMGLKE